MYIFIVICMNSIIVVFGNVSVIAVSKLRPTNALLDTRSKMETHCTLSTLRDI